MSCINSIAYVQRQIDRILRSVKNVDVYVDNIVCESKSLSVHLNDLQQLFICLVETDVSISLVKIFLNYSDVSLLDQKIDFFDLFTSTDKLKVIFELKYSQILSDLKHYLELMSYLRNYIHFYAQLARSLQDLKTRLLKATSNKSNSRKAYSCRTRLEKLTSAKWESFLALQAALSKSSVLIYCDLDKTMWIDLNVSKKFDFEAMIFHVKKEIIISRK